VKFAALTLKNMKPQIPGLKVAWVRSTQDRRRTVVEVAYEQNATKVRGRQYYLVNHPEARFFSYQTDAARFAAMQPMLLSVLANMTFLDPLQFKETQKESRTPASLNLTMSQRKLPDRSASMLVPSDWELMGAKGAALSKSPDGNAGFAFSTAEFWGPSNLPYFDSSTLPGVLHYSYRAPVDAMMILMQRFGSSAFQVLQRSRDPARAAGAAAVLKRGVDVETAVMTFTNEHGVRCKGYYDVLGFQPMASGQWSILFYAVWAPEAQFESYLPALVTMSESFRINEQWAAEYIRQGMENLKRAMAKTSRMMAETASAARESSLAAFQERMRSQDYLDYKRTSTIRGEQEWLSQVEGGALYKSDHWGLSREGERVIEGQPYNYYNYEGKNPRYNESMTPVDASREVYESVYGKGR
jgi:hypothetical protein